MSTRAAALLLLAAAACNGQLRFQDQDAASTRAPCTRDTDCGLSSLHCDSFSGACVACTADIHCGQGARRCDSALHRCIECGSQLDCASGQVCEAMTHRCVPSCVDNGAPSCPPTAPTCEPQLGLCVECQGDADCDARPASARTRTPTW